MVTDRSYLQKIKARAHRTTDDKRYVAIDYIQAANKLAKSMFKNVQFSIALRANNNLSKVLKPKDNNIKEYGAKNKVFTR